MTGEGVLGISPQAQYTFLLRSKRSLRQRLRLWTPTPSELLRNRPSGAFGERLRCRLGGRVAPLLFWICIQRNGFSRSRGFGGAKPPSATVAKQGFDPVPCSMATNYLSTRTGTSGTGAGAKHAAYISALDRHADKTEVRAVIDKNIPASVAKDGLAFFKQADELERANGRSYRSVIVAIPREAADKTAWAQTFVDALLKDKHAYRLAIHDKGDGNPHAHLMFSERCLKEGKTAKDFFSRQNPKDRFVSHKDWLKNAKALYLTHVQKVAPDYVPKMSGEPKIGQKLKNASPAWEAQRAKREKAVTKIRRAEAQLQTLDGMLVTAKTNFAIDQHRPAFNRLVPAIQAKAHARIKLHISKPNKDGSPKTLNQVLDDVGRSIALWLKFQTEELERRAQEARAQALNVEIQAIEAARQAAGMDAFFKSYDAAQALRMPKAEAPATPVRRSYEAGVDEQQAIQQTPFIHQAFHGCQNLDNARIYDDVLFEIQQLPEIHPVRRYADQELHDYVKSLGRTNAQRYDHAAREFKLWFNDSMKAHEEAQPQAAAQAIHAQHEANKPHFHRNPWRGSMPRYVPNFAKKE